MIAACLAFIVSALWVSVISQFGLERFVNSLGAVLAPAYGILIADYYLIKRQQLNIEEIFTSDADGRYHYTKGWNRQALTPFVLAAMFSLLTIWLPALEFLLGFGWLIGAFLAGLMYWLMVRNQPNGRRA